MTIEDKLITIEKKIDSVYQYLERVGGVVSSILSEIEKMTKPKAK